MIILKLVQLTIAGYMTFACMYPYPCTWSVFTTSDYKGVILIGKANLVICFSSGLVIWGGQYITIVQEQTKLKTCMYLIQICLLSNYLHWLHRAMVIIYVCLLYIMFLSSYIISKPFLHYWKYSTNCVS